MSVRQRHNVIEQGTPDGAPMLFAHGFGCDQNMWRFIWPEFADDYRIVLFDYIGMGDSDRSAYEQRRYASLAGYAADVLDICRELELEDVNFVGHSVSAMIGVLAAIEDPERFGHLILVSPSPRYLDDEGYVGGFSREDVDDLLAALESNYLGWSAKMAPLIMGNDDRPELSAELTNSFCKTDPEIARQFARATFLADNRDDLKKVATPSLVLQCDPDVLAPVAVGEYVADAIPEAELAMLDASGHCPNLSAPEETSAAIRRYLEG